MAWKSQGRFFATCDRPQRVTARCHGEPRLCHGLAATSHSVPRPFDQLAWRNRSSPNRAFSFGGEFGRGDIQPLPGQAQKTMSWSRSRWSCCWRSSTSACGGCVRRTAAFGAVKHLRSQLIHLIILNSITLWILSVTIWKCAQMDQYSVKK